MKQLRDRSVGILPFFISPSDGIKYLLIQQVRGHWAFPKGHPNEGESDIDTARRELSEETGISSVTIIPDFEHKMQYTFNDDTTQTTKEVCFFAGLVTTTNVRIDITEVQGFAWLGLDEAVKILTFKDSVDMLLHFSEFYNLQNS